MKISKSAVVYILAGIAIAFAGLTIASDDSGPKEQTDFPPAAVVEDDGHNHKH